MARQKNKRRSNGRRSPIAAAALIAVGLLLTGGLYAGASVAVAASDTGSAQTSQVSAEDGEILFQANCATCHGLSLEGTENGPSLYGVGALAVEFQVATGRMPMQAHGPQADQKPVQFTDAQILSMAEYVHSIAPGPGFPEATVLDGEGDVARGAELFRINCAMCHNVAAAGGALTEGKFAPDINDTSALHIYAAMVTGPQNMPVFNNMNLDEQDKRDVISALLYQQEMQAPGGFTLGSLGPVSEGLFIWIFGIGGLIAIAVWITARSN
ncbi:cytochrome c [Microbacterium amylolyticum]|uniref:Cytochrome bc1 complex cytochrome c subunit n=1 Tax=Microbacterium amylolyticum TaxID=936337 RepID=A0ABS4ZFB7_9MICO|nr:cytochrome c [Microbacterium amylolyticum]MBP2435964.1 ubiquinol-cytochrome c reductase cytochrome c subunit [Microbacterium amylolyticum]